MTIKRPGSLLVGQAFREAAATDLQDITRLVRKAVLHKYYPEHPDRYYLDIYAMSATHVVVEKNGRYQQHSYSINDENQVTVGEAEEVTREFKPVSTSKLTEANNPTEPKEILSSSGRFIEAKDEAGKVWEIRAIDAGTSKNNVIYPPEVLKEAVPLFEGVRVFSKSDQEHLKGDGKDFNKLIGRLINPRFVEAKGKKPAGINADFEVLQTAGDTAAKIYEAVSRDMAGIFGFSIDASGTTKKKRHLREATSILQVDSVDLIVEPGAGGQIVKLIEANSNNNDEDTEAMLRERMIEAIKAANNNQLPESLDVDNEEALFAAFREAQSSNPEPKTTDTQTTELTEERVVELLNSQNQLREARLNARMLIAESKLPDAAKSRLNERFAEAASIQEGEVAQAIKDEVEYLAKFTESGKPNNGGGAQITESASERTAQMLDNFFDPKNRDVNSFKECYIQITGDTRVTGKTKDVDMSRLREAMGDDHLREALDSSSWAAVLGDSITRRMIADYNSPTQYSIWRNMSSVVPLADFRNQERTRYGGYGDLPIVPEKGSYDPVSSPGDEKATYAAAKRGGTESITLEMVKNDDVGAIRRIPQKLSRAAQRTLSKFVIELVSSNALIYDGKALFHDDHGNLGVAELSSTSLAAARLAMLKQTELGSDDRLGIGPKFLWVPPDLEEAAVNMFRRNTENDKTFTQSLSLDVIPVWYWEDPKNWFVTADNADMPLIEVGFMDGNEEPEVFVQDSPTSGSLFNNDTITYKIRHIYGGAVLDYRGAYGSIVA